MSENIVAEPEVFINLPSVCVVLLPYKHGLVLIRRNLNPGKGELALPGGFQEGRNGHSLKYTAVKEVKEETGLEIRECDLRPVEAETDEFGHNVLFFLHDPYMFDGLSEAEFLGMTSHDHEVQEIVLVDQPIRTCFPFHTLAVRNFFEGRYWRY